MDLIPGDIITATIPEFCRVSGLGRQTAYNLIGDGQLKSIKVGKRRLIVVDSYRQMVADRLAAQQPTA
jgi:excisionase family DNA binding protein